MLTGADWFWLMLIDADCSCLMLIGAVVVVVINADWFLLFLIDADWCWLMLFYWSISPEFSRSIFKWPLSCSLSIPQPGMSLHLPHLIPRKLFLNVKGEFLLWRSWPPMTFNTVYSWGVLVFWCSVRKEVNEGRLVCFLWTETLCSVELINPG